MKLLGLFLSLVFIITTLMFTLAMAVLGEEKAGEKVDEIILTSSLLAMAIVYFMF